MIDINTLKRAVVFSLFGLILIGCSKYETVILEETTVEDNSQLYELFNLDDLPEVKLTVPLEQWNLLLTNYDKNKHNDEKVLAHFDFNLNGVTTHLDSIGIRLRGNTSRRRPEGNTGQLHQPQNTDWNKCHFGLDFNKFVKGQRFNDLKALNLKWFKHDSNYVRNIYCYDLFERFGVWTAPQASYCKLTIYVEGDAKPAYYGVYALLEPVNEDYLKDRSDYWGTSMGNLWKASGGASFEPTNSIGIEYDDPEGQNSINYKYDLKTNEDELTFAKAELNDFISNLNNKTGEEFKAWINSKMDISLFLKTYAVNVIVGMWDDYWVNAANYYFYFPGDGKAYFIPYDYDNTLGTSYVLYDSGSQDPLQWGRSNGRPLINKILSFDEYREEYKGYLKELIDPNKDLFHTDKSIPRLQKWKNLIETSVPNETNQDMSIIDKPAPWADAHNYRLFSGGDTGRGNQEANFFKTKIKSIYW